VVLVALLLLQTKPSLFNIKSTGVKKSEIIENYKREINKLSTKEEKTQYLKQINQELARNIFFDQNEIQGAMRELTNHAIR
jgi:tRNA G26 N,N-dimethylase Trm1